MQVLSKARRLAGFLKSSPYFLSSDHRCLSSFAPIFARALDNQCQFHSSFTGSIRENLHFSSRQIDAHSVMQTASFSMEANAVEESPTAEVKELYDKIIESVKVKRTMSPNAWLWSLIENSKNRKDIELLFDVMENLRIFRLSHLRIHENFNCALCREVAKACARVGALDFGKRTLSIHNVYGLAPSVSSANHLLTYAKNHKDAKLMEEVMTLLKKNNLPLQPSTADLVCSICYDTNSWELISKYMIRFVKAGVKLRRTTFDMWMQFAALRGDTTSLWKIEELRAAAMKNHSLTTGFACAKGYLLEHKPADAATVIQILNQTLPEKIKPGVMVELEKLVNEWPLDVIKHQKEEDRKVLAVTFKSDIPAMVSALLSTGLKVRVNLEELMSKEGLLSSHV